MNDWKSMPDGREKRYAYMSSPNWAWRRQAVIERCDNVCERCRKRPVTQVHHKTYARLYAEKIEDLEGMCDECHPAEHCQTVEQLAVKVVDTSREADAAYRSGNLPEAQRLLERQVESMQERDAQRRARVLTGIRGTK